MNIVLKNQVEASEKSAQQLEDELQHKHRWAMLCYNVQDLARSAVTLFSEINDDVDRWQRDLVDCTQPGCEELVQFGKEWDDLYRRISGVFERTFGLIRALENKGYSVDGKKEFLEAWRELRGIVCFSRDRVAAAVEQIQRGEVRSLGDVERELQNLPKH